MRLDEDRLCCLVIVGVRPDGSKELVALADGYREPKESWAALLRSLRDRGLAGPVLAVGDGALGFWAAIRDVFPSTKEQRCWAHKTANCLDALPRRLHPQAKSAIQAVYNAGSRTDALSAAKAFADAFSGFPKATAKIMDELDTLLAFYDFPKEHWVHLRTTNPIESTFSTVRLRTRVTRGAGSRKAALAMAYKLLDAAQARWHKIAAPELVPLVRAGATFIAMANCKRGGRPRPKTRAQRTGPSQPDRHGPSTTFDNCSSRRRGPVSLGRSWRWRSRGHASGRGTRASGASTQGRLRGGAPRARRPTGPSRPVLGSQRLASLVNSATDAVLS